MFRYQPESDTFLCPDGQLMKPRRLHSVRLTWEYVTERGVCLSCRLRKFCTRSRTGRTMRRNRDQKLLDRARRQANTKQAKLDRKRRQHLIERSFADASNLHGFKRARWRGLIKQSIQDLLIATVQNLRKLGGAGIVHAACWAHARRKFFEALKVNPRDQTSIRIVAQMDELFAIDEQARKDNLNPSDRHLLRLEKAKPLLEQIKTAIQAARGDA